MVAIAWSMEEGGRGMGVQKERLEQELATAKQQVVALKEALDVQPDYGMGEGDPAITQWELDQAMLDRLEGHIAQLREALRRLELGTYGTCERCGAAIHPDRLAALPDATLCMACARKG
jgi:DnaK suppressor protein